MASRQQSETKTRGLFKRGVSEQSRFIGFEKRIGYRFKDKRMLEQALSHSSYANEKKSGRLRSNERLEFLGDAVLELVSSHYLYARFPTSPEGVLTRRRAALVCEPALAACAREIGLDEELLLGRGEEMTGGRKKDSLTSDAMEALIGAVYLDGGMKAADKFIREFILSPEAVARAVVDYKTEFQEHMQRHAHAEIRYETAAAPGAKTAEKYVSRLLLNGKEVGTGRGSSKKGAEQQAAKAAMEKENGTGDPCI